MHIVVIGAGVVGVTTAYALHRRGHQVTVIERQAGAGLETSKANAGQRSYGVVYPWASAAMVKKALPWLLQRDGPLKLQIPPSLEALRFMIATLRFAYAPGVFGLNKRAMLRLGIYSRTCFDDIERELGLEFDGDHAGLLHLASTPAAMSEYGETTKVLRELGIAYQLLTPAQVRESEPGMTGPGPLYGALKYNTDGTGDCHLFSQALAAACEKRGVKFCYNTVVERLASDDHRVHGLDISSGADGTRRLEADAFVVCAGSDSPALTRILGLRLPIYPIKGYSLTAPLTDASRAPVSTIHDDHFKVVSTRLGDRIRATGFVELAGFDRQIHESRLAVIRRSVESRYPGAADMTAATAWTGFRPMTPDGPPIMGKGPRDNLYLNTGHGTFGWTLSAASADLIAELIDGQEPALSLDAFRPGRFSE